MQYVQSVPMVSWDKNALWSALSIRKPPVFSCGSTLVFFMHDNVVVVIKYDN